jgi:hypothetical protein
MNRDEQLTYRWLRGLKDNLLKEDKIKDHVRGNAAVAANDVGALDVDFTQSGGDYIELDPKWVSQNIIPVTLVNGSTLEFHKKYANQLAKAFEVACRATGWTPENRSVGYCPQSSGGFVSRRSRAKDQQNLPVEQRSIGGHAWGTNVDFGAAENPYGPGTGKIRKYPAFINAMKQNGFIWGGDWSTPDDMHFEVNMSGKPVPLTSDTGGTSEYSSGSEEQQPYDFKSSFSRWIDSLIKEGASSKLSDEQIAKLLYDVGFRDEDLVTAVRIVIGESGGNPSVTNVNVGASGKYKNSVDRGLFQFNNVAFPNFSDEDAFNPIKNAEYAFRVYKKVGFKPWRGKTQFHTLKHSDGTPDTDKIERAKNAVAKLTGYVSTGNYEYLPNGTSSSETASSSATEAVPFDFKSSFSNKLQNILKENKNIFDDVYLIKDKTNDKIFDKHKKLFTSMLEFYNDELKFELPVSIRFIDNLENAKTPLGKTGYYNPDKASITIFTTGRLLKDIMRSLGHELIHHKQHCKKPFQHDNTPEGYAQKDKILRRKEKEAYLFGNMLFRDWEDNYKTKYKGVF